jgi:uncharacterized iron-regulated membrane protein
VHPGAAPLPWRDVLAGVNKAFPSARPTTVRPAPAPNVAAEVSVQGGLMVSVDPYTGQVLGSRRGNQILMSKVHQFHTRLLMGEWGERITGWSTLAFLVLSVSGLVLWWRRKGLAIRWRVPWRAFHYDAHHAIGIWSLLPGLALGITGAVIGFEEIVRPALYSMTHSHPAAPPAVKSQPASGGPAMTVDDAAATCSAALPGAELILLRLPANRTDSFMAYMRFPEDHTPGGRSRVFLDQYSGKVLWLESSRTSPAGTRLFNLGRPIHTGDIFGWPTRILACLASLALAFQCVSGVLLWRPGWGRRPPRGQTSRATAGASTAETAATRHPAARP